MVLIVEDMHECLNVAQDDFAPTLSTLLGLLVELYNAGNLNVCYTMSDFERTWLLRNLSGHSRLRCLPFPKISDADFIPLIRDLAFRKKSELEMQKVNFMREFFLGQDLPDKDFFHFFKDEAAYIVSRLNSHMGDTVACLQAIIEHNVPPKGLCFTCSPNTPNQAKKKYIYMIKMLLIKS